MTQKLGRRPSRRQRSHDDLGAAFESSKQYALKMLGLPTRTKISSSWNRDAGGPRQEQHHPGAHHDESTQQKKRASHMSKLSLKFTPRRSPPLSFPAGLGEYFFPERQPAAAVSKPSATPRRSVHFPTPSCPEIQIDARRIPTRRSSVSSANLLDWMPPTPGHRAARSESSRYGRDIEPPPRYPGPPERTTSAMSTPVPGYHSARNSLSPVDTSYPAFLPPIQTRSSSLHYSRSQTSRKSQHSLDEIMMGPNRPALRPSRSNSSPWNLESTTTLPTLVDSPECEGDATPPARPATSAGLQTSSQETIRASSSAKTASSARFPSSHSRCATRDSRASRVSQASTSGSSMWDSVTCRDSVTTDGLRYSLSSAMSETTVSSGLGIVMPIPESPSIPAFPVPPKSINSQEIPGSVKLQTVTDDRKRQSLAQRRRLPGAPLKKLEPPHCLSLPQKSHRRSEDDGMTSMDSPVLGWFPSHKPIRSSSCPPRPDDVDGKGRRVRPVGVEPDPSPSWVVSPRSPVCATSPIMVVASIKPDAEPRSPWALSPVMVVAEFNPVNDGECDGRLRGVAVEAGPPAVPLRSPQRAASPV